MFLTHWELSGPWLTPGRLPDGIIGANGLIVRDLRRLSPISFWSICLWLFFSQLKASGTKSELLVQGKNDKKCYVHSLLIDLFASWHISFFPVLFNFPQIKLPQTQASTNPHRNQNVEQHLQGTLQRNVISVTECWSRNVLVKISTWETVVPKKKSNLVENLHFKPIWETT